MEIFYVGVGQERRAYVMSQNQRNFLWNRYVNKNGKPIVEIYKTNLNIIEASYLERVFIDKIGRRINKSGNLVNITKGGEGCFAQSESVVADRLKRMKSFNFPKGENHWSYGKEVSEETRKKISKAGKGRKQSPEHIEKRAAARRGKRMNSISIEKMANSLRGRTIPQDVLDKMSVSIKRAWANEEYKKKMCEMRKGQKRNCKKVINTRTKQVFNSGKEAAEEIGIKHTYLCGMLGGTWNNKTEFMYLNEYNKILK